MQYSTVTCSQDKQEEKGFPYVSKLDNSLFFYLMYQTNIRIELYICRIFVVKVDTKQCRRISISPTKSIPNLSLNSEVALPLQGEKS